jgi:hypothetical protein
MIRHPLLLLPLLAVTYCAPPPPPVGQARADAETLAACRQHADQVYNRQYRDQIYTITNTAVPFSAAYAPGVTDSGLAARYAHDNMVSDCVRNTGTETDRSTTYDQEPATTTTP